MKTAHVVWRRANRAETTFHHVLWDKSGKSKTTGTTKVDMKGLVFRSKIIQCLRVLSKPAVGFIQSIHRQHVPKCVFFYPPGGIMSSFLMGCYDPDSKKWCTVTKCSGGYDDATLARLQKELDVIKISKVRERIHLEGLPGILNWCNKIEK